MRQSHYPTPQQYQNHHAAPDDLQHVGYEDLPLEFLGSQAPDYYGSDASLQGLDRRLSKQLSLGSFPGESTPTGGPDVRGFRWGGPAEAAEDYSGTRMRPRHARSISLGVDSSFGGAKPPSDAPRRNQQVRQSYQPQGQYGSQGPSAGRGGRYCGNSYGDRGTASQSVAPGMAGRGEGERGQGYRKLWQQVTKVGRGQKLGENAEAVPFSDMTVEDLLRIVRNLPPEESAVQAVSRGLYYLDSRALAALLKELHKVGLSNRAAELFDWLRGLPEGHELLHLCDVYTYTTIISQCGSHQQLRKALELVAEMRSRGIPCNVHTYSALMNVCIKANELDLALDVYNQLLREGCTPNLVTYNILIDVHGKTGQWHDAVKVLDALENQGTKPEVRTYNTIINACNRSGQPDFALKVYERMIADGAQPTATTYTALISAYGKTGKVEEAIHIFQDMVARNCERNVITYSSLISACEKAGRWQLALDLFQEMHRDSCKPNVVTYNALIAACGQGGQWKTAAEIFEGMVPNQCKPDSVTYGTLISAFDKGGQWGQALQAYEEMQNQGHRPDVGVYNVLVEVLSRSGSQPASLKAIQLFLAASRQGQFRMVPQSHSETTVIAFTVGAASLAMLQWLQDLRARLSRNITASPNPWSSPGISSANVLASPSSTVPGSGSSVPSASGQGSPSASACPERATLVLLKGKHGRSESPPASIEEACSAILIAANIPHAVAQTPQGVRVEVEVGGLQSWPDSKEVDAIFTPFTAASNCKLPTEMLISGDQAAEARCCDAFSAVQAFEESHPHSGKSMSEADQASRGEYVNMLVALARGMGFGEQTVHDSVQLLDRLVRRGLGARNLASPVLLAAVALIAAQQGNSDHVPADSAVESMVGCSVAQIAEMQENVRSVLERDTGAISAVRVLHLYLERLQADYQDASMMARVAGEALHVMGDAVFEPSLIDFPPSLAAASVLYLARRRAGALPFWPQSLAQLTGYVDPRSGTFAAAIELAETLFPQQSSASHLLLVPSPIPAAPTPPKNGISPPMSQNSLPSLSSLGSITTSSIRRTASGTATQGLGLHGRQNSGLQATLSAGSAVNGLARSDSLAGTTSHLGLEGMPLPRTPSLTGTIQPAATQSSSYQSSSQLL